MKRPKKAEIITIKEAPHYYIHYEITCPHCHTLFIYNTGMEFINVLMYKCPQCKNPIDLRKKE